MGYYPWYRQIGKYFNLSSMILMTPFELYFSNVSENHKKFDIGSTEFKLWQPKESLE